MLKNTEVLSIKVQLYKLNRSMKQGGRGHWAVYYTSPH